MSQVNSETRKEGEEGLMKNKNENSIELDKREK
jgi:hypothetical protein